MFDPKENLELIDLFKRLRASDVRDGMDWVGYHHYGTVHHSIRPLFRPELPAVGIARTARYVPFEGPVPMLTHDDYTDWVFMYYDKIAHDPYRGYKINPGDFLCYDIAGLDVGVLGSNCTLDYAKMGVVGYLTNGGGVRDTDECIIQKINVWSKFVSQPMNQCRIRYVETDTVIAIGGVAIYPGDIIVADGDGVIVVPRKIATDVAKYARKESNTDKTRRKEQYKELGMKPDDTLK